MTETIMHSTTSFLVIACALLCACEASHDLGDECVPLDGGSPAMSTELDADGSPRWRIIGRPLGHIGRRVGCIDDPTDLSNCFNPFHPDSAAPGAGSFQRLDERCACLLDDP
jgi:hypothetical protein